MTAPKPAGAATAVKPCELVIDDRLSARETFFHAVEAVAVRERLRFDVAMAEVKVRRPDLVAAAFPRHPRFRTTQPERQKLAA